MCGRFNFTDDQLDEIKEIIREVNDKFYGQKQPKMGTILPTDMAAVLPKGQDGLAADVMRWGFPPIREGERPIINARSESVLEKPRFSGVLTKRCLIPSAGFYEKDYIFHLPGTKLLYMAGFFDLFQNASGEEETRFVILTTAANRDMERVHDRMPLILRPEEYAVWFSPDFARLFDRSRVALEKQPYKDGLVYAKSLFD